MDLKNDQQLANTERKLALLEEHIEGAKSRPATPANRVSMRALVQTANQLREEIIRYRSQQNRRAAS
jgi:hypothetical protein